MKVGIYTLGCKVNTYESEYIANLMTANGFDVVSFNDVCDVYIINTCTVTNNSDVKSRKIIRQAKKRNPASCLIAIGCFIEANKKDILENIKEIDIAVGNENKGKIIEYLNEYLFSKNKIDKTNIEIGNDFEDMYLDHYNNRTRAFVKVQDGCENFCSYCIIPKVRGKCRSKDLDKAIKEIKDLVENDYQEIVLTGIHTGNYGVDLNTNFASLLREVVKIDNLKRLRISSIEITELTDEVLSIIKENEVVANHLHIPIQAGSNKILKLMNRKYDIEKFTTIINKIREIRPNISITTDIITGHPGEDEETLKETIENIRKLNFSKLHVFPYSIRKDTPSARLPQVEDTFKKKSTKLLLELSNELEETYLDRFITETLDVLIEQSKDGKSNGHSSNYIEIEVEESLTKGNIYKVDIIKREGKRLVGKRN